MDGVAVASLTVSGASLVVAILATLVAKSSLTRADEAVQQAKESLKHAKDVADRAHDDWAQQKWFDLFFKASFAKCTLDKLRVEYPAEPVYDEALYKDISPLIFLTREIIAMGSVFPQCVEITNLMDATSLVPKADAKSNEIMNFEAKRTELVNHIFSDTMLRNLNDAIEGVRQKALVDSSVLERKCPSPSSIPA